ncbi:hypothetical protein B0T17DRAFT_527663 [Bombardia bombarda]|uniref:Peptidase S54 rhomboid domain-containing protein n=1 Tax=Bombardia bombarda TaxID=252184 RepID=A0AA39XBE4_9PEZI|nr:hypothetical protein B0T17DRAFT_527663 [Bombardia bombarda]
MNCSLGVNAFRSSVQIAAQHFSRPSAYSRLVAPSRRCLSSWLSSTSQQYSRGTISNPYTIPRKPQWPRSPQHASLRTLRVLGHSVITHYVDLPPNYTDEEGLAFSRRDIDASEVLSLFGPSMGTLAANKLLRILHGRRVAGTLDDPELQVHTLGYSKRQQKIALGYLRKTVNVDEIVNAGLRAEDELAALEGEPEQDEVAEEGTPAKKVLGYTSRFKLYKGAEADGASKDSVYGTGAFDAIRARNRAKYEEEMKRKEELKKQQEEELAKSRPGGLQTVDGVQTRQVSPRMQEWLAKATSDLEAPPEMKKWERILPSALVVLLLSGLLVAYAEFYRPPSRADRLWPDVPPAAATVAALIALNILVYAAWKFPPGWSFMNRYFLIVPATPKPISFLGATFSHQQAFHLAGNVIALWFFGVRFHDEVGRANFLATYLTAGTLGFLGTLTTSVLRNRLELSTLGASGAIYGIATAYFWMHRFEGFKIFGLPPDPIGGVQGLAFLGMILGLNIAAMFSKKGHQLDITSHLVGMAVGLAAGTVLEKKQEAKKQRLLELERQKWHIRETGTLAPSSTTKVVTESR